MGTFTISISNIDKNTEMNHLGILKKMMLGKKCG
jgi:hypothetical protein